MEKLKKFFDREFWSIFVGLIIGEILVLGVISIFLGSFPKVDEINLFGMFNHFGQLPKIVVLDLSEWFWFLDVLGWFLLLIFLKKMNDRAEDEYPENIQRKIKYLFISFLFLGVLLGLIFGIFLGIIISLIISLITGIIVSVFWEKNELQIELATDALFPIFYSATAMMMGIGLMYGPVASLLLFLVLVILSIVIIAIAIPISFGTLFVIWLFSAESRYNSRTKK